MRAAAAVLLVFATMLAWTAVAAPTGHTQEPVLAAPGELRRLLTQTLDYYIPEPERGTVSLVTFVPSLPPPLLREGHTCGTFTTVLNAIVLSEESPCLAVLPRTVLHEHCHALEWQQRADLSEEAADRCADRVMRVKALPCIP